MIFVPCKRPEDVDGSMKNEQRSPKEIEIHRQKRIDLWLLVSALALTVYAQDNYVIGHLVPCIYGGLNVAYIFYVYRNTYDKSATLSALCMIMGIFVEFSYVTDHSKRELELTPLIQHTMLCVWHVLIFAVMRWSVVNTPTRYKKLG